MSPSVEDKKGACAHVLVVDDDPAIRKYLRRILTERRYGVCDVSSARTALHCISERTFDLMILGLDSPDVGWSQRILSVRALSPIPIVAISVRDNEDAVVEALESGADDYVSKPFGTRELLARVQSVLRRRAREQGRPLLFVSGDLKVDLGRRLVWSQGRQVRLAVKPYNVLRVLVENSGNVVTHEQILFSVWGEQRKNQLQYLRLAIRKLRRSLEPDPVHQKLIVTETRVGYRLLVRPPVDRTGIDFRREPANGSDNE